MKKLMTLSFALLLGCGSDSTNKPGADAAAATDDADNLIDAAMQMADATVGASCGSASCTADQECCVGNGGSTCVASGTCNQVSFACDGPEDCPGEVCCYGGSGGGSGGGGSGSHDTGSTCESAAACDNNACHDDTDCGGQTTHCCAFGMATAYKICLAQCPML